MIGIIGKVLISLSFVTGLGAGVLYFISAKNDDDKTLKIGNWLTGIQGLFLISASAMLVYLLFTHQFQYYYVFNYTSLDLPNKYLWSAFYGGQEGSFMLWIFFSWFFSLGLMKWVRAPYKAPVLFFLMLTQVFLLSMILGWHFGDISIGASPFRTIAEEMPNAPFIQANPNFVPADGSGLNDLLKSPWMMIHPPILFVGFAMMTIPYCFAMAALWKRKYNEWVNPALPWTLGANVALLTAIFLGGYWAYVTLSFGGFWAWDPVENASLVPWLFGTAGIHTMIIQRKSSIAQKSSLILAILAYVAIVYETFLTRSGILSDSSVHSFVDLGLYGQLLIFMIVITGLGLGMFFWRYKELPTQQKESKFLSREFMTFTGAVLLLILGLVIIFGTSSPIRSEEHTSELQSRPHLVCRLLLEKKNTDISYLNNADIENISILKDAASAAIYGSQAANGVVLVTTRKGRKVHAQISFDHYYCIQEVDRKIDMINSKEYATLINESFMNS